MKKLFFFLSFSLSFLLFLPCHARELSPFEVMVQIQEESDQLEKRILDSLAPQEGEEPPFPLLVFPNNPNDHLVSPSLVKKILQLQENGTRDTKSLPKGVSHIVVPYEGVHFKSDDLLDPDSALRPRLEEASGLLWRFFVGREETGGGLPPTAFFVLKNIFLSQVPDHEKKQYAVQGSLTIPGETLETYCSNTPVILDDFDPRVLSELAIFNMLRVPNDGKGANYIVNKGSVWSIDNDWSFRDEFDNVAFLGQDPEIRSFFQEFWLTVKKFRQSFLHPTFKKRLLTLPSHEFFMNWLSTLWLKTNQWTSCRNQGRISQEIYENNRLDLVIPPLFLERMAYNLSKVRFLAQRDKTIGDIFRSLHPLAAYYYEEILGSMAPRDAISHMYTSQKQGVSFSKEFLSSKLSLTTEFARSGLSLKQLLDQETERYELTGPRHPICSLIPFFVTHYGPFKREFLTPLSLKMLEEFEGKKVFSLGTPLLFSPPTLSLSPLLSAQSQTPLTTLNLEEIDLTDTLLPRLVETLIPFKTLTTLILASCNLGQVSPEAFKTLEPLFSKTSSLLSLSLAENELTDPHASLIASFFEKAHFLRILDLRWNRFSSSGGRALQTGLQMNPCVSRLFLEGNALSPPLKEAINTPWIHHLIKEAAALSSPLRKKEKLRDLNCYPLDNNGILINNLLKILDKEEGKLHLIPFSLSAYWYPHSYAQALMISCSPLTHVDFSRCYYKDTHWTLLIKALQKCPTLEILEFQGSFSRTPEESKRIIGEVLIHSLPHFKALKTLGLGYNNIMWPLFRKLAPCLFELPSLTSLDLSYNKIQEDPRLPLIFPFKSPSPLESLDLSGNPMGSLPSQLKERCPSLKEVSL